MNPRRIAALAAALLAGPALLPNAMALPGPTPAEVAEWNAPQAPFKVFGNTYYVGTKGLTSLLITSDFGHVLIDAGLPESAPLIRANIEKLGFKVTDIKAILNSHAHFDHAGGIAELQKLSGASVYVRRPSDEVLRTGKLTKADPQYGVRRTDFPPVKTLWIVSDEELLGVGSNRLQAFATAGHTPGGTTWTWESCEGTTCLKMVYADMLRPISADKFKFSASKEYPTALADFDQAFKRIESLPCDVLITPHPDASEFFERIASRPQDKPEAIKDPQGCKRYVAKAREDLAKRVASESVK